MLPETIVETWRVSGFIVVLTILVNLLTNMAKIPQIEALLGRWAGFKPLLAVILGILSGSLSCALSGAPIVSSLLSGLLAGLGSTGFHELVTILNTRVQTERDLGNAIVKLGTGTRNENEKEVGEMFSRLKTILKEPNLTPRERLDALSDLLKN